MADRPQVYPFGICEYVDPRRQPPIAADAEADALAGLLAEWVGGEVVLWPVPAQERTLTAVTTRLMRLTGLDGPRRSALIWVGHGTSGSTTATLVVRGGDDGGEDHELEPETLAKHIHAARQRWARGENAEPWVIVMVEACGAAAFVRRVASALDALGAAADGRAGEGVLLIGVGNPLGESRLGVTRELLTKVNSSYTVNDQEVDLHDWSGRIARRLKEGALPVEGVVRPLGVAGLVLRRPGVTVSTSLDVYAELAPLLEALSRDERTHFARKGMGADFGELAWHFVGRESELARIAAWLREGSGLLAVTGRAGTGKSAVLGNLVLRSHPDVRQVLTSAELLPAEDDVGQVPPFDVSLHLRGAGVPEVVAALLAGAGVSAPERASGAGVVGDAQLIDHAVAALRDRPAGDASFTVLADGLDEARTPLVVATLLRRVGALHGCRVVVGTRASTQEGPDHPVTDDTDLLDALTPAAQAGLRPSGRDGVELLERDPVALETYVTQRLSGLDPGTVAAVATAVARGSDHEGRPREFLFARLVVHELLVDPSLLDDDAALADLLAGDHRSLFWRALDRLSVASPTTGALVTALAHARGRGLPRADGVWAAAASAVAGLPISETDADLALQAAAPYLLLDGEAGQSVYRLAHYTFVEHFTARSEHHDREQRVLAALVDLVAANPEPDGPKPEVRVNPYLVDHLAEHASGIGEEGWALLARHPWVLDRIDPAGVADQAMATGLGRYPLPPEVLAMIAGAHTIIPAAPADRPGQRHLAMATQGVRRFPAEPSHGGWALGAAARRPVSVHRLLPGHTRAVSGVAAFGGPDGRTLLATTSHDQTVRIWDPTTATQIGDPLTGHTGTVSGVAAFAGPGGRTLLATTSHDRTVRVWDPATATQIGDPLTGHTHAVTGVAAFAGPDGRTLLATTSWDQTVRIWDPATATQIEDPLTGHTHAVTGVAAFAGPDGRTLLATTSHDQTVRVWDPATATQIGDPLTGHTSWVTGVAAFAGPGGRTLLATTSHDRTVRIWDPATATQIGDPLTGHTDPVTGVAAFPGPDGRTLLATTSHDRTVRIWDPATATQIGDPLTGHTDPVTGVAAFGGPDGRTLLATTSADRTVRIWDPATATQIGDPLTGHTDMVTGVAAFPGPHGRTLLATTSYDQTVRVWDPATATQIGDPLTGHTHAVTGVAAFAGPDGRTLLATTSYDQTVRVWDPATATQIEDPLTGHTSMVTGVAAFGGPDGRTLLATTSHDRTVRIWDPTTATQIGDPLTGHTRAVSGVAAFGGPDGRTLLATTSYDQTVRVWDPATATQIGDPLTGHTRWVRGVAAFGGPDGRTLLATTSHDRTVRIWDPATATQIGDPLTGHTDPVTGVAAFAGPDGRTLLATTSHDQTVRIWDPTTGGCLSLIRLRQVAYAVTTVDRDLVLALNDGWVRIVPNLSSSCGA